LEATAAEPEGVGEGTVGEGAAEEGVTVVGTDCATGLGLGVGFPASGFASDPLPQPTAARQTAAQPTADAIRKYAFMVVSPDE